VAGSTISFEIVIDDYAEIWVNGKLPTVLGQSGGPAVKGWNAPNKVILTHNAQPGQRFQIAVFGFNGPISKSPMNFIWVKSATLDFYQAGRGTGIQEVETKILRKDPALDSIVSPGAKIEKLAADSCSPKVQYGSVTRATCSLATRTTTLSTVGQRKKVSLSIAPTVATQE